MAGRTLQRPLHRAMSRERDASPSDRTACMAAFVVGADRAASQM
jgi:hypothetical protein